MKDDNGLPISTSTATATHTKVLFSRGRYKYLAFAAISLLVFWSILAATATLRWSLRISDDLTTTAAAATSFYHDLDVLEMEEREEAVKHMWDVYTNSRRIKLPRFWLEAFEAAYEDLTSDVPTVRSAAISEIAKMSIRSVDLEPPPLQSTGLRELIRLQQAEIGPEAVTSRGSSL